MSQETAPSQQAELLADLQCRLGALEQAVQDLAEALEGVLAQGSESGS